MCGNLEELSRDLALSSVSHQDRLITCIAQYEVLLRPIILMY